MPTPLGELASTIRSKNAGVDNVTFDIIFPDLPTYERVRDSGAITRESVRALFGVADDRIVFFSAIDPALAIKFTLRRSMSSGGPGESDAMGSQQYAPLYEIVVP
ncbi:MAG TPA: DUF4387 domain-containing protein [Acidimicrobiia bacterium]|jgi:hypothetical protein|nr:DUF4387 domain-containing protein [Acidimicrobiia bacterium]